MAVLDRKTKVELMEIIKEKENEILDLKDELRQLEKCKKYDEITDEIKDVYDKLVAKGFNHNSAMILVQSMLDSGNIPAKAQYPYRGNYVSYR